MKTQAETDHKTYDSLIYRDHPFDMSDALLAMAMLAVTALTHLWAAVLGLAGVDLLRPVDGCRPGLTALPIHPHGLIKLLA